MYLNAKERPWKAAMFFVWDLDETKILQHVLWANDTTGEYAQYQVDECDEIILDNNDEPILELKKGNIKLREK
jgi:hypothetical protein